MKIEFVAPCLLGIEGLLAWELRDMGAESVKAENGRVFFSGDENLLARANICSRYAERIQIVLATFTATTFVELFDEVETLPFENWIGSTDAFPVKGYSLNSTLHSVSSCQSIIKKAAVKRLQKAYDIEWFEETGPVHQIQFSIMKDRVTIMLDTSGDGLYKRGYRTNAVEAPIKETLAAAMVNLAHLRKFHTLYDPFCGSGTLLIEGALYAQNIAPGLNRNFAAERWDVLRREIWSEEKAKARERETRTKEFVAYGSDIDPEALEMTRENARRAGVLDNIQVEQKSITEFRPKSDKGIVLCNPPYGERMLTVRQTEQICIDMGKKFDKKPDWGYYIISSLKDFEQLFGRRADKRRKLYNGMIECQLYMYLKP